MLSFELVVGLDLVDQADEFLLLPDHLFMLLPLVVNELLVLILEFLGLLNEHDPFLVSQKSLVVNLESSTCLLSLFILIK